MSGDLSPGIDLKSNSWKELNDSFEECKKQLQHEMETREMLGKLYHECDILGTDVVKTTTLIERLSLMVGNNPHVDKALLKNLSILLDPRGDDGYLKNDEFVEIGLKWIEMLDYKTQTNIKSSSRSNSLNATPIKQQIQVSESIEDEIERLTGYVLSPQRPGSYTKHAFPRVPSSHQKSLEHCVEHLNKRLSLETKTLKQQLHSAEGEAAYFLGENESLKKEIEDLEKAFYRKENGVQMNIRSSFRSSSDLSLHSSNFGSLDELDESEIDYENMKFQKQILKEENRMLRCEMENQKNDKKESRHQLDEANKKIDTLQHELKQSKIDFAQLKDEELERLKEINSSQQNEILKLKAELLSANEELVIMSEQQKEYHPFMDISFDQVEFDKDGTDSDSRNSSATKFKGIVLHNRHSLSAIPFSTPDKNSKATSKLVRRSLGDEIKRLGVLGSPFCDKIRSISPGKLNESVHENLRNSPKEIRICSDKTVKLDGCLETINENQCPEQTFEEEERKGMLAKRFLRSFSSMFISIVQTISFLSFSRCPSNRRFKVYFQKHKWIRLTCLLAFLLFSFTFFGAVEVDNRKYYPITWPAKLNAWLYKMNLTMISIPEPVAIISVQHFSPTNIC